MKTLLNKGLGWTGRQADPISREDEEKLWTMNVFGKENAENSNKLCFSTRQSNTCFNE